MARFEAAEIGRTDGLARLGIEVYGRDAADAGLLTKAGRFVLNRDSGPSLTITRLQEVEHEGVSHLADRPGGRSRARDRRGRNRWALQGRVAGQPAASGTALADSDAAKISDAMLDDLYR